MLTKCSNPACSASFRYLEVGKLFRIESEAGPIFTGYKKAEYFWLCPSCSETMTLCLGEDTRVKTILCRDQLEPGTNEGNFVPLERKRGFILSCFHHVRQRIVVYHPNPYQRTHVRAS